VAAWIGVVLLCAIAAFVAWLYILGPWRPVDFSLHAPAPQPPLPHDAETWRAQRSALLETFQRDVYGAPPPHITPMVTKRESITAKDAGGIERAEQWRVEVGAAGHFHLAIVRPPGDAPAPVIVTLDFAGNRAAFPNRPEAIEGPAGYIQWFAKSDLLDPIVERVFGRHVNTPPLQAITSRGYAVALLYAGDVAPDGAEQARAALARFAPNDTGALMAWAWTASRAYDALAADLRFDAKRIAVWGQSRQGKAALVAGAFDGRFGAIVALQSGRGGDAPVTAFEGEPVAKIVKTFPHWFSPRFAAQTPTVEQHQLLALIAPRPLLLGHAARDRWSDPVGARAMREAAAPVFTALGCEPPSSFVRQGGHGIHPRDWDETLNFLDAAWTRA
jgi:hypothetical protein